VEQIRAGEYGKDGAPFLSVRVFSRKYATSVVTAHKVILDLKQDGWLDAAPGNTAVVRCKQPPASTGTPHIGVIIGSHLSPLFNILTYEVKQAAEANGYAILPGSAEHDPARERRLIMDYLGFGVVGFIVTPGLGEESVALYRELVARGIALVLMGREVEGVNADCITPDHFTGGALVARHFVEVGYDSFAYIRFGPRSTMDMRLNGFRSALCDEGFDLPAANIVDDNGWDIANGYHAMAKLASRPNPPRAVMAFNDCPAIGAVQYCQEHGIAVPGDVAIAGFDNLAETRVTHPPLTTVENPHAEVARLAVQALLDRIGSQGERIGTCRRLRPRLVIRGSSDPNAGQELVVADRAGSYAGWM
jgi:DNA-binding LacI/PurR family transcriptional regulator